MFDDSINYYNLYFEYLNMDNGIFKNYEYNILNDKNNLLLRLEKLEAKLKEMNTQMAIICSAVSYLGVAAPGVVSAFIKEGKFDQYQSIIREKK